MLGPRNGKKDPDDDKLADFFRDSGRLGARGTGGLDLGGGIKLDAPTNFSKLNAEERRIVEQWMPRPGRANVPVDERGPLESAVRKLDPNSAVYQAFIKDPGSCGSCHTTK